MSDTLLHLFPGIGSFFMQDSSIAIARVILIVAGFALSYYGFKRKLEPLIMVPMGIGMIAINSGVLFIGSGQFGTIFLDSLVEDPIEVVNIMQINFLQPIYNLTFSNGLIACLVFVGIGARSEISFILGRPWASLVAALFGEMGTFVALVSGIYLLGFTPAESAAVATIGGADGPMVLFCSLILSPHLFVPISIIAYLYLSLTYAAYPYLIKLMVPKKYRGIDVEVPIPEVSQKAKFVFSILTCLLICILLPVAAPLIMSFFLGVAIKEAEIGPYQELLENTITYFSTLFLGLILGTLCEATTILNPVVAKILILGVIALGVSGVGGLIGGWIIYKLDKQKNYNPVIGIAGISCVPTTAKIAQEVASEENPFAVIMPVAMGANICGVIVSAIATGIFISTIFLIR